MEENIQTKKYSGTLMDDLRAITTHEGHTCLRQLVSDGFVQWTPAEKLLIRKRMEFRYLQENHVKRAQCPQIALVWIHAQYFGSTSVHQHLNKGVIVRMTSKHTSRNMGTHNKNVLWLPIAASRTFSDDGTVGAVSGGKTAKVKPVQAY